ncbi:DUF7059 domain-containing protein [Actinacidiphila yeochonensis]|uniref:DUF7059 domain-containing protein n=1 Tax=Actinacidiphila yeochonensis TaxID=89050 RepID=UPI000D1BDDCD|nr:methyltransferase [Actinacidiphila yeochonensis]
MDAVSDSSYPNPPAGGPGPRLPEPGSAEALRDDLLAAGFTADGCLELLGPVAWSALSRAETIPALRATRDGGALAALVRLFLLQRAVPRAEAAAVLSGLRRYEADGWLVADGEDLRATVDVRPYAGDDGEDWWIVSDLGCAVGGAGGIGDGSGVDRADLVLGVGGASTTLAGLTVREPFERALDLGTGSGVQALHASRHATRVTATDVNPRALRMARLTLALSGVPAADLRQGSLFEPVGEERYDLIVSNPPFVISPRGRFTYRDGGMAGDDLCRALVRESADHLAEGGWCQLLANWQHTEGQDWRERVTSWLPAGCDAWIVQREVQDVAQYAELWLRDGGDHRTDPVAYAARYDAWLEEFERNKVSGVGFGWITLRRSGADRPSVTAEEWPHPVEQPLGGHIADWFARQDFLRRHDDAALLDARFTLAPDVVQEQVGLPGAEDPEHVVLRSARGMRRATKVDTVGAGFAGVCDGTLPAGRIVDAIAQLLGEDPVVLRDRTPESIRLLVEQGFLTPVAG